MRRNLPGVSRMALAITCDFDAHSPWIGGYRYVARIVHNVLRRFTSSG